jgi:hypothetical protein
MEIMRVKLELLRDNPFRDFGLYPIDEEQVQRLMQSMEELGFFSGVTARRKGSIFETACGHHRIEAAKRAGLTEVEAVVEPYTDQQMVQIMADENLLQRGHNAASTLDSVAAYAKLIAKEVLLGEGSSSKILEDAGPEYLSRAQAKIAQNGPGMPLVYRAMNGFAKEGRRANKDAEKITTTDIDQALATLKTGGVMGRIMGNVYAEVEAVRAEQAEAEREKREKEEQAAAKVEEQRKAEIERQERELQKRREKEEEAERKRKAAADQDAKARAEAAANAEKRKQEREAAEAALAEQRKADEAKRKTEAKAKADRQKADQEEREKRAKEKAAIKAQKELEAIYDPACAHIFRLTSHEKVFRDAVLSENGRRFIPKANQLALAKHIRAEIDEVETKRGYDLGTVTISQMLQLELAKLIGIQRDIDDEEQKLLLQESAQKRVEEYWKTLRRGMQQAESALEKLVKEQSSWPYDKALFPMYLEDITRIVDIGHQMERLKRALGYSQEERK